MTFGGISHQRTGTFQHASNMGTLNSLNYAKQQSLDEHTKKRRNSASEVSNGVSHGLLTDERRPETRSDEDSNHEPMISVSSKRKPSPEFINFSSILPKKIEQFRIESHERATPEEFHRNEIPVGQTFYHTVNNVSIVQVTYMESPSKSKPRSRSPGRSASGPSELQASETPPISSSCDEGMPGSDTLKRKASPEVPANTQAQTAVKTKA